MIRKKGLLFVVVILTTLLVTACGGQVPPSETKEQKTIKIGLLPIEDNLPFYVAEQDDLYTKAGIKIELVNFASAVERDTALQAGQIDGEVADLVAVGLLKKGGTDVKVASIGLGATPAEGRFAILSSPKSGISKPEDLKNVEIGVSENSIIDYVTDKMLLDSGLEKETIKMVSIPKIPVRLDMLLSDQIKAATLPDPLATLAESQGAHLIIDDTKKNFTQTVLLFRSDSIRSNPEGIQGLVKVYEDAGQTLNQNPDKYRSLFIEKARVPKPIEQTYKSPTFSKLRLPTEGEITQVMDWMVDKKLLDKPYSYEELIDSNLLPKS